MAEYIERKRLEEAFDNADPDVCESYPDGYSDWGFGRKNVREVISSVPAADVAPVVQGRETREGGSTMNISEAIDRAVKAKWRADLINMLADAGRTLEHANLRANGNVYRDINVGLLLLEAARSLQECQSELEPENPDDVVVKVTVPDRWPMTEAGQRRAAQEAAATKPMTNGDRIRAMTDEELAESDELLSGLCNVLHGQGYPCEANTCRECLIKWLGSPEKEAAPEPVTSGDRIRAMTAEELAERERLERLYEETRQITVDMLCVALRDKQAMGDDVWGKERIVRLLTRLNELREEFGPAFRPGPEQDYMQEQLDGALREIFGVTTVPFAVRHPYIREIDYTKRRR